MDYTPTITKLEDRSIGAFKTFIYGNPVEVNYNIENAADGPKGYINISMSNIQEQTEFGIIADPVVMISKQFDADAVELTNSTDIISNKVIGAIQTIANTVKTSYSDEATLLQRLIALPTREPETI